MPAWEPDGSVEKHLGESNPEAGKSKDRIDPDSDSDFDPEKTFATESGLYRHTAGRLDHLHPFPIAIGIAIAIEK